MRTTVILSGLMLCLVTLGTALGCSGGMHRAGQQQVTLAGSYGHPIKGEIIWPDGEGRAENYAPTVAYNYFATDRLALTAALTPYRYYSQERGDTGSTELQLGLRYYIAEFDIAQAPAALFVEALGGLAYSNRSVPEDGSNGNFTQDTGVGLEVKLSDAVSWISGYRLRHLSNGRVFRSDENPSQNDNQVYTGLAITW